MRYFMVGYYISYRDSIQMGGQAMSFEHFPDRLQIISILREENKRKDIDIVGIISISEFENETEYNHFFNDITDKTTESI